MSTLLNTNGEKLEISPLNENIKGKFYIVTAEWNPGITHSLRDGALSILKTAGVKDSNIISLSVPGTVELVNVAAKAVNQEDTVAVIVIGCVIRGDTPHFDYVCMIAADGIASLNAKGKAPVIFGVLTVDNEQQAIDRAGGSLGNKGEEAAAAAISLANLSSLFS
ncbi:MAG: 6,7-dimethyl-8-ribityllumazine synthase [Muribaculaceae bacterium]|nr:6,7-dimethyl-8-ribityllumazine synthase [Muribaculaceae bacterium]